MASLLICSRPMALLALTTLGSTLMVAGCANNGGSRQDAGPRVDMAQVDGGQMDGEVPADMGPDAADTDLGVPGALTTYLLRPDERDCASPLCGGYFLTAANQEQTLCADGTLEPECYVAELDWAPSALSSADQARALAAVGGFLVDGRLEQARFGDATLGLLRVSGAWISEWGAPLAEPHTAPYHSLARTALLCLVDPCFNIDVDTLNTSDSLAVSGLDLDPAGASAGAEALGQQAMEDGTLRATGVITTDAVPGPGGFGETYHADQFFVQLPFDAL